MLRKVINTLRKTLKSSEIIENWLSSRVVYSLIRHNIVKKRNMLVRLKGGSLITIPPRIYSLLINAYFNGLIHEVYKEEDSLIIDGVIKILKTHDTWIYVMPDGVKLLAEDPDLREYGETEFVSMYQTWILGSNLIAPILDNRLVIDIGSFIGDTALYYAKRGAFVVAVEPVPSHYNVMLKNLKLNPELMRRVIPVNAAISSNDGLIELAIEGVAHGGASQYQSFSNKIRVRSLTLKSLLRHVKKEHGIDVNKFNTKAIKFDCEGCEYDVINNELDIVSSFDFLLIECHGYLRGRTIFDIMNRLSKKGFYCELINPDPYSGLSMRFLSTLRCFKYSSSIRKEYEYL